MLTSPLATTANWVWDRIPSPDLPDALRSAFPSTSDGPAPTMLPTRPIVQPDAIRGTATASSALLFPFTGWAHHVHDPATTTHWVWGSACDVARSDCRTSLPHGNPLIAVAFNHAETAGPSEFPSGGVIRGAPVVLAGPGGVSVTEIIVVAAFPGRPGLDTLGVLRSLRAVIDDLAWGRFVDSIGLEQPLRLLEPSGRPVSLRTVTITDTVTGDKTFTLEPSHRGDLLSAGGITRTDLAAATRITLTSTGENLAAASLSHTATDGSVAVADTAHIDLAVLDEWFGPRQPGPLQRYTRGNTVRPFVNGPAYFDDLFTELHRPASSGTPKVFYLTGYGINESAKFVGTELGVANRTIADVAAMVSDQGGEARFLALQFLQVDHNFITTLEATGFIVAVLLMAGGIIMLAAVDGEGWDQANFFGHVSAISFGSLFAVSKIEDLVDSLEPNKAVIDALAAIPGVEAHLDPYPAECADNPTCEPTTDLIKLVHEAQNRFGAFHQKIAIIRNDTGVHAYCGGIDMAPNRLDDSDHGRRGPFHDVHARVEGLAAGELARTFSQRWQRTGVSPLSLDAPGALDGLPSSGDDIVQIGRTYFGPVTTGTSRALPFAPSGERTILDTLLTAIGRARRYIYIEDQYLTPPTEFVRALQEAAARVSGPLIIAIPDTPDQPFGFGPRQQVVAELTEAWGDRLKVGTMRQRFSRAQTNRTTATGRLWLVDDADPGATSIMVGPPERVPDPPFWIVVGGESMWATRKEPAAGTPPRVEVFVERGAATNLFDIDSGPERAAHKARAAVTAGSFPGVYVHAKVVLIDDAFASIGSANSNHRGYYSDGECNVFAMRETLLHGDNWIKLLRIQLWAELLGITPEFAHVSLSDPTRHMALFDRKFLTGSRFTPFAAQPFADELELQAQFLDTTTKFQGLLFFAKLVEGLGFALAGAGSDELFGAIIDPSSWLEQP